MKRIYLPLLVLALAASCDKETMTDVAEKTETQENGEGIDHSIVNGEAIVRFSDEMVSLVESDLSQGKLVTRSMGLNQTLDEIGISSIRRLFPDAGEYEPRTRREGLHKWYIVNYRTDIPQTRAATELESIPGIEYVESHRSAVTDSFNDTYYSKQWGLENTNSPGYDINVTPVWSGYTTGDPKVIVAVVDEGIDISHTDLAANCSKQNYSTISYRETVVPGTHGTHVAGIIAALGNNGIGVAGVAGGDAARGEKGVTVMSCEMLREVSGNGKTSYRNGNSAAAIKWAADHGAVICQNSWAYTFDMDGDGNLNSSEMANAMNAKVSKSDQLAIDYFIKYAGCDNDGNQLADSPMKGGLVLFAAGNDNIANGAPANYEPVIAVAAIDRYGNKATYSNYGEFVDIAAPGSSIYSTKTSGEYGPLSGTSMACPHVSGVAALLVSYLGGPGFTCEELKSKILNSKRTSVVPNSIGGLVDAMGALMYGEDFVPEKAENPSITVKSNSAALSWPVSGDSKGHPAYGYAIVTGKKKADVESADPSKGVSSGVTLTDIKTSRRFGETISADVNDLNFNTTYYVKIVGYSYAGTYGKASDVIEFTTEHNHPPVIELTGAEDLVIKSHETKIIDVNAYDPDGHKITCDYKEGSVADSFSAYEDRITIRAYYAKAGDYTAEITATDIYGASTTKRINYRILENTPPQKIKDIENMLITGPSGTGFTLEMKDYFIDPDGEELNYTVTASNPSMIRLSDNGLYVGGVILQDGTTDLTITAYDSKRATATSKFVIVARKGDIEYTAYPNPVKDVLKVATGKDLETLSVKLTSQTGVAAFEGEYEASAFKPAEIDLTDCAPGKYKATFKFGGKEYEQTIIKK